MGGELATEDRRGKQDLVWVHVPRIVAGAIRRLSRGVRADAP